MSVGPYVFGPNRRSLWVASSENLTDKLKHYAPRLRNAIPNLTDVFLPPEAGPIHKDILKQNNFFVHMYAVAHDRSPVEFADYAVARHKAQGVGALELNFEGGNITDGTLASYMEATMKRVRSKKPNLPVRANVVPFKGRYVSVQAINNDPQLYVCVQAYGGNMDILYAADEVKEDLVTYGVYPHKVTVMHAVMCSRGTGPRQLTLPAVRDKGAFYIDDLLLDAGLL
jgi:hypothetical protein